MDLKIHERAHRKGDCEHQSDLNPAVWEGKLFEFLNKTDALIEKYAAGAERSLQDWRKQLEMEFKNL